MRLFGSRYRRLHDACKWAHAKSWLGFCLVAGALLSLTVSPAPLAEARTTPTPPVLPGICSESDRFGLATTGGQLLEYDVAQLHAGWYANFASMPYAPHPADMAFMQMIRLSDDDGDTNRACLRCPAWSQLAYAVQTNPGAIWLIGNEPDSQTIEQDNLSPCRYAQLYKEMYDFIKAIDASSLVGIGGIVQPTPIRIEYLGMILDEYLAQFGVTMPIDVWNTHNYILREKRYYGGTEGSAQEADDGNQAPCASARACFGLGTQSSASLVLNELDADTPGADAQEFVELYDGGVGETLLNGLVVVFFDGTNDRSYFAADLDGYATDSAGYFVLGNAAVSGVDLVFANNLLQNGPDAAALYQGHASNFPPNSPVTTADLVDAIVYGTADADDPGLLSLLNSCQPQVDEARRGSPESDSSQRCPNGAGAQRSTGTFAQQLPTPGSDNCQDECYGCWGAGIPPGIDANTGILYEIDEHLMLDRSPSDPKKIGWKQQIVDLREFMAKRGYRDRPLIVSEYGNLMPVDIIEGRFHWDEVGDFLVETSDWLLQTTDPSTGCPTDGNRLVQAWAWWPFDYTMFGGYPGEAHLFDPHSHALTPVGLRYSAYTQELTTPHPGTVDLRVFSIQNSLPTRAGGKAYVNITADIVNAGALPSGSFPVEFEVDGQAGVRVTVSNIAPGARVAVQIAWSVQIGEMIHVVVTADPDNLIADCDPYNDSMAADLWIGDHATYLPAVGKTAHP